MICLFYAGIHFLQADPSHLGVNENASSFGESFVIGGLENDRMVEFVWIYLRITDLNLLWDKFGN